MPWRKKAAGNSDEGETGEDHEVLHDRETVTDEAAEDTPGPEVDESDSGSRRARLLKRFNDEVVEDDLVE